MANKKILKTLRQVSDRMPERYIQTFTEEKISGWDLILCGHKEVEGKPIDPEGNYIVMVPTYVQQNNYKDLKKAYSSKGVNGVVARINQL